MRRAVLIVLVGLLGLTGCASGTRVGHFGPLTADHRLVTLVVSEDPAVVARECQGVSAAGPVLGCQMSWPVATAAGRPARAVKIVRYTDSLPSPLAFEIDIHELCHTVAALQLLDDPCGNDGVAQSLPVGAVRTMLAR